MYPKRNLAQIILTSLIIALVVGLFALALTHAHSDSRLAPGQTEISILIPGADSEAAYVQLIPAFEKANPNIKVKRYDIPSQDEFVKMQIMLAAGSAPDLIPVWSMRFPQFVEHGAFLPLDQFMADDPEFQKIKDDIYPKAFEGFGQDGKIYGLATRQNNYTLYYNKTIFDEYNKTAPPDQRIKYPDQYSKEEWTLDRYMDLCKKLTRDTHHTGRIDQWGTITQGAPFYIICPILRRFGADLFNADKTRCTLDDPKAIQAMQWYFDLVRKGVAPNPSGADARSQGATEVDPRDVFASGCIAMFEAEGEHRYAFAGIKTFQWDIAEPPCSLDGTHTIGWECSAMAITHSSEHPREAWKFISFLLSPEGQKIILKSNAGIPVLKSLCNSKDGFLDPSTPPEHKLTYLTAAEYGKDIPALKNFEEVEDAIKSHLEAGLADKTKTAEECCKAAAEEANRLLAENREE